MIEELIEKWELNKELIEKEQKLNVNYSRIKELTSIIKGSLFLLFFAIIIYFLNTSFLIPFEHFILILGTIVLFSAPILIFISLIIRAILKSEVEKLKPEVELLKQIQLFELQAHINEITHLKYIDTTKAENNEQ